MEQYLTTQELSGHIKMTPGTIRNLVWRGVRIPVKPDSDSGASRTAVPVEAGR